MKVIKAGWIRALSALLLLTALSGCGEKADHGSGHTGVEPAPVAAEQRNVLRGERRIRVPGTVEADERSALSARVSGVLVELEDEVGATFKRGDLLVRLEANELKSRVAVARAQMDEAAIEYERSQALFERNALPESQWTAAQSRLETTRAQLEEAETQLSYLEIRAPFDGQVSEVHASRGDLAVPGAPLLHIISLAPHQFTVKLPESLKSAFRQDGVYPVRLEEQDASIEGTVAEMARNADPASRTYLVKLALPNEPGIRPGTFGYLEIGTGESILMVDSSWVMRKGQLEYVYTLEEGVARLTLVRTGGERDGGLEVVAGLGGDETLLVPTDGLKDGIPVVEP